MRYFLIQEMLPYPKKTQSVGNEGILYLLNHFVSFYLSYIIGRKMETDEESVAKRRKKDNCLVLLSIMEELYSENEFCDVTIQVGNRSFKTHRYMLAALSEYFHAMFVGNF